jgi:hypothetical protein
MTLLSHLMSGLFGLLVAGAMLALVVRAMLRLGQGQLGEVREVAKAAMRLGARSWTPPSSDPRPEARPKP